MTDFTPGDVSASQVLTDNDHIYPEHNNELRQSRAATAVVGKTEQCEYYCDGIADDVQIQAAIDAVNGDGGGVVYIKAGSYTIASAIEMKDNVAVVGAGIGVTILTHASTYCFTNADTTNGNSYMTIKNITLDGDTSQDGGVRFTGPSETVIENVEFLDQNGAAPNVALSIIGASGTTCRNIKIINNLFYNCTNYGVNLEPTSSHYDIKGVEICNNTFYNVQTSIAVQKDCFDIKINNNIIAGYSGVSIGIKVGTGGSGANESRRISINDNILSSQSAGANSRGINVADYTEYYTIANNTIYNYQDGIYLNVHPKYGVIQGNLIYDCENGIITSAGAENAKIDNNQIKNCSEYGIYYQSTGRTINGNTVDGCGKHGIYLGSACDDMTVNNNVCKNNGQDTADTYSGIYCTGVTDTTFVGNRCYDDQGTKTQKYGIDEGASSNYNTIMGNNLRGNSVGNLNITGANTLYETATDGDALNIV